ncbi:MAG: hypothetical protein WCG14_08545 [Chlamydiia bacterium]|jgi:hypothetical protein
MQNPPNQSLSRSFSANDWNQPAQRVHVHSGGQSIVGNVIPGGGVNQKLEEGPHAKV